MCILLLPIPIHGSHVTAVIDKYLQLMPKLTVRFHLMAVSAFHVKLFTNVLDYQTAKQSSHNNALVEGSQTRAKSSTKPSQIRKVSHNLIQGYHFFHA